MAFDRALREYKLAGHFFVGESHGDQSSYFALSRSQRVLEAGRRSALFEQRLCIPQYAGHVQAPGVGGRSAGLLEGPSEVTLRVERASQREATASDVGLTAQVGVNPGASEPL